MPSAAIADTTPMGRPRKNDDAPKFYEGKLYALLAKKFPDLVERGRLNTAKLAARLQYNRYTVYNWMDKDRLTRRAAIALQKAAPTITDKDLLPFLLQS